MKKASLLLSLAVFWGLSLHAQTLPSGARVIGNDIGASELSVKELRRALRGEVSLWPDSKKSVTVVFHAMSMEEECSQTAEFVVSSSRPAVLQKYWLGKVFEGRANPPIFVRSEAELIDVVTTTPGSIGLLYNAIPKPNLRIETVEP